MKFNLKNKHLLVLTILIALIVCLTLWYGHIEYNVMLTKLETTAIKNYVEKTNLKTSTTLEWLIAAWVYNKYEKATVEITPLIIKECLKTKEPLLILAIIGVESHYVPSALSSAGAMGLGQIMPNYHSNQLKKLGIIKNSRDLYNIKPNIKATEFVLLDILKSQNGNIIPTLEKYSGKAWGYPQKVLSNYFELSRLYHKALETDKEQ